MSKKINYTFHTISQCPLIKKYGKPTEYSRDNHCDGFEAPAFWLPTIDERCEECPHYNLNEKNVKYQKYGPDGDKDYS